MKPRNQTYPITLRNLQKLNQHIQNTAKQIKLHCWYLALLTVISPLPLNTAMIYYYLKLDLCTAKLYILMGIWKAMCYHRLIHDNKTWNKNKVIVHGSTQIYYLSYSLNHFQKKKQKKNNIFCNGGKVKLNWLCYSELHADAWISSGINVLLSQKKSLKFGNVKKWKLIYIWLILPFLAVFFNFLDSQLFKTQLTSFTY